MDTAQNVGDDDAVSVHLTNQVAWYSRKSRFAQRAYKAVKLGQIGVGAAVPVVAALSAPPAVTASISAVVVVAEGVQQLFQWQVNWLNYRSTAEALKHEQFLYLAEVAPYAGADRRAVLAHRIESLVSQENVQWSAARDPHSETSPKT